MPADEPTGLSGPTVKYLRRQRRERERERRTTRPPATQGATRIEVGPAAQRPTLPGRAEPAFPLSTADLLELDRVPDVAVLEGRVLPISWSRAVEADRLAGARGGPGKPPASPLFRERVTQAVQRVRPLLVGWARGAATGRPRFSGLAGLPTVENPREAKRIERFIHDRLIPRLRQEGAAPREEKSRSEPCPPEDFFCSRLERHFAFSNRCWYRLVPFWGQPGPKQFHLQVGSDQFLGVEAEPRARALQRYDRLLQEGVRQAYAAPEERAAGKNDLYRDRTYAVIRASRGRYLVCRWIPAYVVEGEDRRLHYFDPAEVAIPIPGVKSALVIRPHVVRLTHPYRHMFVHHFDSGLTICMPRPDTYYRELHRLPLEEALLRHLDSARLTLCAGYTPAVSAFHPIGEVSRRTLSPEEALAQGLPVYRYYRGTSAN